MDNEEAIPIRFPTSMADLLVNTGVCTAIDLEARLRELPAALILLKDVIEKWLGINPWHAVRKQAKRKTVTGAEAILLDVLTRCFFFEIADVTWAGTNRCLSV
jgi:hypothetical protein